MISILPRRYANVCTLFKRASIIAYFVAVCCQYYRIGMALIAVMSGAGGCHVWRWWLSCLALVAAMSGADGCHVWR